MTTGAELGVQVVDDQPEAAQQQQRKLVAEQRRTETPNAVMTTVASPTLGGTVALSLWWVEMTAGSAGPQHVVDSEQIWSVLTGTVEVDIDGTVTQVRAGDTAVLPEGSTRRISALTEVRALVSGYGDASVFVPGESAARGTPPWIA